MTIYEQNRLHLKSAGVIIVVLIGVLLVSGCGASERDEKGGEAKEQTMIESEANAVEEKTQSEFPESEDDRYRVVFLGNSITAGFGVDEEAAFPFLIQTRVDEQELPFRIVNAGLSGDTSSGGLSRIEWLLRNRVDVLVLELGGNDGLRGIDLTLTRSNLEGILDKILEKYPECELIVAGMMVPPNLGHEYTRTFREIFPQLARKFNAELIPFILEGVGGVPELNQPDGIHPTAEGHVIVAETVWKYLEPVLHGLNVNQPDS